MKSSPNVPGDTPWERLDNAARTIFKSSKRRITERRKASEKDETEEAREEAIKEGRLNSRERSKNQ